MKNIQPSVVIGLGGTGVRTITFLKRALLEQAPDIAEFVRFLAIDIDELKGDVPSFNLFGDNIRLDPEKNEFFRIRDQTQGSEAKNTPAIESWFPEEGFKYLPLTEGARQAKPIGRLGFFLAHEELALWLHRLTDKLVTPETKNRFPGLKAGELNIYVVASICGGTGAGLLVDVAYELRYLQQQAELPVKSRIKGLFALGDIYDAVSNRVLANTYATLRELNWTQREDPSFTPIYPDGSRQKIHARAYDAIYLVGPTNESNIELSDPAEFAQLCSEFIYLDSGADAQEDGDSLSAMIQSARNNVEVYAMNHDADGTPRCYSAVGLCKIRFPFERVRDLCAAKMVRKIIERHVIGELSDGEVLEAKRKAREFITTEGLTCNEEATALPDRLINKELENGSLVPLNTWITQSLAKAYSSHLEDIKELEIGRIDYIINTLDGEIRKLQDEISFRAVEELHTFGGLVERTVEGMLRENLGVRFVARFLQEILDSAQASRDYAQQESKNYLGHEKRLADQMEKQLRELRSHLDIGVFSFLKVGARRAQLKETFNAIRQNYLNRVNGIKMRVAVDFYRGVHNEKQKLEEGGEGAISRLTNQVTDIDLIETLMTNLHRDFRVGYEENRKITGSPFEITIYDNEDFYELNSIFKQVYGKGMRTSLFKEILQNIGGSIWNLKEYVGDDRLTENLREQFMETCRPPFMEEIDKKTVAQRIRDARRQDINYEARLQNAYEIGDYYCRLNKTVSGFSDLRYSEQSISVVVAFLDEDDQAWKDLKTTLREGMRRGGKEPPFSHSSDRHSILIYRELSGFPAYTLARITSYHDNYVNEAKRENTPPLQMLTKEKLEHINVPNKPVLSKSDVLAIEALALGIIVSDDEYYYLVTEDEWRRRTLAEEAQARGKDARVEDRTAGNDRKMGATLSEVVSKLGDKLPDSVRISNKNLTYRDEIQEQIKIRKELREEQIQRELLSDLYEALYFEGYSGTDHETIDLETNLRPGIEFALKQQFGLNKDHIYRPEETHHNLLRTMYIGPVE